MEKRSVTMTRRDLSHNVLEVAHTAGVERWLVVKKMLYPKKARQPKFINVFGDDMYVLFIKKCLKRKCHYALLT